MRTHLHLRELSCELVHQFVEVLDAVVVPPADGAPSEKDLGEQSQSLFTLEALANADVAQEMHAAVVDEGRTALGGRCDGGEDRVSVVDDQLEEVTLADRVLYNLLVNSPDSPRRWDYRRQR